MSTGVTGCLFSSLLVASIFLGRKKVSRVRREQTECWGRRRCDGDSVCGQRGFSGIDSQQEGLLRLLVCGGQCAWNIVLPGKGTVGVGMGGG